MPYIHREREEEQEGGDNLPGYILGYGKSTGRSLARMSQGGQWYDNEGLVVESHSILNFIVVWCGLVCLWLPILLLGIRSPQV